MTRDEQACILDDKLAFFLRYGYTITNRTETAATLRQRKGFDWYWFFVIGWLPYLLYYLFFKETYTLCYEVLPDGTLKKTLLD